MTIVLKRKINYHLLQTYLPSGERPDLLVNSSMVITELDIVVYSSRQSCHCGCGGIRNIFNFEIIWIFQSQTIWKCCTVDFFLWPVLVYFDTGHYICNWRPCSVTGRDLSSCSDPANSTNYPRSLRHRLLALPLPAARVHPRADRDGDDDPADPGRHVRGRQAEHAQSQLRLCSRNGIETSRKYQ